MTGVLLQRSRANDVEDQIAYYRKPFMVLWAAVQEASSELEEDYGLFLTSRNSGWLNGCGRCRIHRWTDWPRKPCNMAPANRTWHVPPIRIQRMPCADFLVFMELFRTRLLIDEVLDSLE